jgi:hypothetical protein
MSQNPMDEMNQGNEIDGALREIVKRRDGVLGRAPTISPARQTVLSEFLAAEFPVEAALREAATKRDRLLKRGPEISWSRESSLLRQLRAAEAARDEARERRVSDRVANAPAFPSFVRSPLGGGLAASTVIAVTILCFAMWETSSRRNAGNLSDTARPDGGNIDSGMILDRSLLGQAELFTRTASIRAFNLETNEPASLQASFLANSGIHLADGNAAPLGLRLDLPARAIFLDDILARTP